MVYQFKSIKGIIDGIYRDYDSANDLEVWDVIEWCAEALELIGAGTQYVDRIVEIDVTNHTHPLPCDFHHLMQISYKGRPLSLMSGTMGPGPSFTEGSDNFLNSKQIDENNFPQNSNIDYANNDRYYIQNSFLVTSFEEGTVVMSYKAIQADEEGYPMIPENVYYDKALKAYCQMMIDRKEWRKGNIPAAMYSDTKADWLFYVKAAASSAMMPNLDKVENFKNSWVRLKPLINQHDTFFSGTNIREIKKLK